VKSGAQRKDSHPLGNGKSGRKVKSPVPRDHRALLITSVVLDLAKGSVGIGDPHALRDGKGEKGI